MNAVSNETVARVPEPARMWMPLRWMGGGGVRELLIVSLPMMLSNVSVTLNLFFDRWFLSRYDLEVHMPASLTAGEFWWPLIQIPNGIGAYIATFVPQ